jgi:hypothetical protein
MPTITFALMKSVGIAAALTSAMLFIVPTASFAHGRCYVPHCANRTNVGASANAPEWAPPSRSTTTTTAPGSIKPSGAPGSRPPVLQR